MSASGEAFEVPTRTQREPAAHRGNSRFFPRYRAVARSMRPRRNPCHHRANHHWFASPCGSGTASHRFRSTLCYTGPQKTFSMGHPIRPTSVDCGRCVRSTPTCSLLGSDRCRNTRHSREGGGMRSYLHHNIQLRSGFFRLRAEEDVNKCCSGYCRPKHPVSCAVLNSVS